MVVGLFAAIFFALVTLSVVEVPMQQKSISASIPFIQLKTAQLFRVAIR